MTDKRCRCHSSSLYDTLERCPGCGHWSFDPWAQSCERRRCGYDIGVWNVTDQTLERDIVIGAGGPPPEDDVADGTYPLILTEIGEWRPVTIRQGDRAGQQTHLRDWTFRVNATGNQYDGRTVRSSASAASGPKSKQFGFIVALNGGKEPAVGQKFDVDELVGRMALGKVYHDDGNYPKVDTLIAMPVQALQGQFQQATTAAPAPAAPLRESVAGTDGKPADDLPF